MKILLARTAGFCMGVRRATKMAVDAVRAGRDDVVTLGPLIHNAQAVDRLRMRGIRSLPEDAEPEGGTVVVRAHGMEPGRLRRLSERGLELLDATCPHVLASRAIIRRAGERGHAVVLVGDANHPEVRGLQGHAVGPVYVVSDAQAATALCLDGVVEVLAQTTFSISRYEEIYSIIRRNCPQAVVHDSICSATKRRQDEARELAKRADALVVVGGMHSANTRRLAEIGRQAGKPTFHVETADELRPADFDGVRVVAVTAGASTPGWLTQQVIDRLEVCCRRGGRDYLLHLVRSAARARLTTALGAAALCHACARLLGVNDLPPAVFALVTAFVFVAYTINRREPWHGTVEAATPVDRFYVEHRRLLLGLAALAAFSSILLCLPLGWPTLALVALTYAAAILYSVPMLPGPGRLRRLKDLPASKDLLVAAAWAVVLVGLIHLNTGVVLGWKRVLGTAGLVFLLVFAKTVMLDLRDIESDHLIGRETLPILIGRGRAVFLVYCVLWCLLGLCCYFWLTGLVGTFAVALGFVPFYGICALYLLARSRFRGEVHCQLVVDAQLLLAGVLSLAWGMAS